MISKVGSEVTIKLMHTEKPWKIEIDQAYGTTDKKDLKLQFEGNGLSKLDYQKQRWSTWSVYYYVCGRKRIFDWNKQDF